MAMNNKDDNNTPVAKGNHQPGKITMPVLRGLQDVDVTISVEWGRSEITVAEAVALGEKSLLRTDKRVKDPVDILVNGKLFGRGRLVLVGDTYGVQVEEIFGDES